MEQMHLQLTYPVESDATTFLGRRNSCLIFEGLSRDVASWTEAGLKVKDDSLSKRLTMISRIASTVLLVIFVMIPIGTTYDHLSFIALAMMASLNLASSPRAFKVLEYFSSLSFGRSPSRRQKLRMSDSDPKDLEHTQQNNLSGFSSCHRILGWGTVS